MKGTESKRALLASLFENNRINYALTLTVCVVSAGVNLMVSWLLGAVVDAVSTANWAALTRTSVLCLVCIPLIFFSDGLLAHVKARFVHRGMGQYKAKAFSLLSKKSVAAFTTENTGTYLSALTNDALSVENNYLNSAVLLVYYGILFFAALGMMLWYSPLMTLIVIVLTVLPIAVTVLMGNGLAKREKATSDRNEAFTAQLKDLLGGFAVIKSFQAEARTEAIFCEENTRLEHTKERRRRYAGILNAASGAAGAAVQFGIFLIGAVLAMRGSITVGTVLIFVNLCNFITQPLQVIPEQWANRKAALALIDKLAALLTENAQEGGEAAPKTLQQGIVLDGVTFGYEADKPVLRDVCCTFAPGKSYAVVGASGSGKSTLLHLLMGARRDYTGSLTLDEREVRELSADSLFDLMSLIGQNVFLFDTTIRSNITMFASFPDEDVARAIRLAGLEPVIAQRGEEYRCGENGVHLSGGERQRISIARSLLRGSNVLLVDEATSALDNETAQRISSAILDLDGLTRIIVTHRLEESLLSRYDGILMLKNGVVCEQGTFDQLMAKKGQFYSLYTVSNG